MTITTLGIKKQINCLTSDFYIFLGYLASHPQDINIYFEYNAQLGAWGNEGRILFKSDFVRKKFAPLGINVTAGIKNSCDSRLNCNALFEQLITLGFIEGEVQNAAVIQNNIPPKYQKFFIQGMSL